MLLLRSPLTAAEEQAKNEEPAMDLSATFRSSLRLSVTGVTYFSMHPSIKHMPLVPLHRLLQM